MASVESNMKSVPQAQQQINERYRLQGVTAPHVLQQQESKSIQVARTQNIISTNLSKVITAVDEFKYGFPSDGLSTVSNKWWGSSSPDSHAGACHSESRKCENGKDEAEQRAENDSNSRIIDNEGSETKKEDSKVCPLGTTSLTVLRKRAVEEGRVALKLGVFQGYSGKKLGWKEKALLLQIFRSSLPKV